MTTMTMRTVSISVSRTSWMALSMYLVESKATCAVEAASAARALILSISARTRPMTSSELALGSTQTPMKTARLPDMRTSCS